MNAGWAATGEGQPRRSLGEWLIEHGEIVLALISRDLKTRFSHNLFGYSWSFVAPILWIGGTYSFFYFLGRTSPVFTDIVTFIISGLIPYVAFRYTANAMGKVNGGVRSLVIYPTVTPEHAAVAMAIIEYVNVYIVAAIIMAINYVVFGNIELDDLPLWAGGITLAWLLGAAYGYLFSVLSRRDVTIFQLGIILLRPSYFFSAVFFIPNEIRGPVLDVLGWNPLMHAVDISRDGMLFHYQSHISDALYVVVSIVLLFGAAIAARPWRSA
jgi:capsular polysaccharide transport system permease protein